MTPKLKITVITFNCARELIDPTLFARNLAEHTRWHHDRRPDFIFLALQEVAPIAHSFLGGSFIKPYLARFGEAVRIAANRREHNARNVDTSTLNFDSNGDASTDEPMHRDAHYVTLAVRNVGMTAFILFVRNEHVQDIRWIETAGTGLGHWEMGNKGCVGVRVGYSLESASSHVTVPLTFMAAHFAPGEPNFEHRNANWRRVVEDMVFVRQRSSIAGRRGSARAGQVRTAPGSEPDESDPLLVEDIEQSAVGQGIYGSRSHVFIAGDFNYRTADSSPSLDDASSFPQPQSLADSKSFNKMLDRDQLSREHQAGHIFHGFLEAPIHFPPTYKYSQSARKATTSSIQGIYNSDPRTSVWSSKRWPSWCDRVLVLDQAEHTAERSSITGQQEQSHYMSLPLLPTSDHQPVYFYKYIDLHPYAASLESGQTPSVPAPFEISPDWQARRAAARRAEIAFGLLAYFGWTWEGNALVLATLVGVLGGWVLMRTSLESLGV